MRNVRTSLLLLILVCGAACNNLTRDRAKAIIASGMGYPKPIVATIQTGVFSSDTQGGMPQRSDSRHFIDLGLLAVRYTGRWEQAPSFNIYYNELYFTPAGSALKTGKVEANQDRSIELSEVRQCEEDILDVTGVQQQGQTAQVEYTTKVVRPTGFAQSGVCLDNAARSHSVELRLYDDGWRAPRPSTLE